MTIADKIRKYLTNDINTSAVELAEKLGTTSQHVYQIRHEMKKKQLKEAVRFASQGNSVLTRTQNEKTLATYVLEILKAKPIGMQIEELTEAVLQAGYITNSANFTEVLRQRLYTMINKEEIIKDGNFYTCPTLRSPEEPVQTLTEGDDSISVSALLELNAFCLRNGGAKKIKKYLDLLIDFGR